MLAERHLELLTAFVDGELTRRQRKAVLRLLHQSSEARSILQDLQEAAHRLRTLPPRTLGNAFAGQVLQAISDRGLQPAAQPVFHRRGRRWLGYAAAAALLFAVGMEIYLATRQSPNEDAGRTIAATADKKPEPVAIPPLQVKPEVVLPPLQMTFKDLSLQPAREKLATRLRNETAVHLNVTVRDSASAVEHVEDVLKSQGIQVIIDPRVHASLKQGEKAAIEYLVYAENIRPQELEALLWQLADEPKNPSVRKGTFESMLVTTLSGEDRQKLSGLLGVHPSKLKGPARPGDAALFENKIIEAPKDRTKAAPAVPAPQPDRYALIMAGDRGTGVASSEVRRFFASRQQQRPGTMQVLLVIRLA
jgi:hypothetical protein